MTVILIGGSGTIGKAIKDELSSHYKIINVGRKKGDILCDITSEKSIEEMYQKAGRFNAVIVAAGEVTFAPLQQMNAEKYQVGLNSKLMGQVHTVLIGTKYINDEGSFTLTSGILSCDPIVGGSSASMVNSAINGFVVGASIELPRGIRLNAVSPTILEESVQVYGDFFMGYEPVSAKKVALAYSKSVNGRQTGKIYTVV